MPPEPKACSPLLNDNTEGPLYPVVGHTSVRSGLVIPESSGEGEGSQAGRSWHVSKACQVKFVFCCALLQKVWSPDHSLILPVDSRPEPEVSPEKNRTPSSKPCFWKGLYELSCYPWPAQVERHHVYGGRLSFTGQSQQLSVLLHQARRRSLHTYSCLQMSSFLSCSGPLATFFQ